MCAKPQLANYADTTTYTVRNYMAERLLICADHTECGHRLFNQESVKRLKFIRLAREAGLLITDIKPLIYAIDDCDHQKSTELIRSLQDKVKVQINHLNTFNNSLNDMN